MALTNNITWAPLPVVGVANPANLPHENTTTAVMGLRFVHYNAIKDPQWYAVQGSDTTMMPIASWPGQ